MLEAAMVKRLRDYTLDYSFSVKPGEILVLMGLNGSGKSTTLNIIAGLLNPDAATITLVGKRLCDTGRGIDVPAEDRGIGYVLQNPAVFPHMTVRDNIAFGLRTRHLPRAVIAERVGFWLEQMHIADLASVRAGSLSGGQRQRVALARALAIEPDLLMLDEPFTALDAESTRIVKDLTRRFVTELGIPCIVVTHRAGDGTEIADRACVICEGRKEWEGPPAGIPELCTVCRCT
ncbi:MAG TPA: ABC transporter ATP-binding protein [Methanomicrobiales archaeon]|nr:ABC transporter ATP-binding protein [Methanomicrobiales archaeon]